MVDIPNSDKIACGRKPMFCEIIKLANRKRLIFDTSNERVYDARLNYCSTADSTVQADCHIYWRLKLRRVDAVFEEYTGQGYSLDTAAYPQQYADIIRGYYSKHVSSSLAANTRHFVNVLAMLRHAGACIAHYCMTGKIDFDILSKKKYKNKEVVTLSNADSLSFLPHSALYLPSPLRASDPEIFNMLYLLGCACDASIAMDNISNTSGAAKYSMPHYNPLQLSHALHVTIFYMLSLMDSCGYGDDAVLALTSGLHSVTTVIAHSDEGGITRDALRELSYTQPYGTMPVPIAGYFQHINVLFTTQPAWDQFAGIWDYVILATAALVHLSDPGMTVNDVTYPTTLTTKVATVDGRNSDLAAQMMHSATRFCDIFVENLSTFWGVVANPDGNASQALLHAFNIVACAAEPNRHLEMNVMAPWYWIESSALFCDYTPFRSPLSSAGYGPQCVYGARLVLAATNSLEFTGEAGDYSAYRFEWTTMRHNPLFNILNKRVGDGLANVDFRLRPYNEWLLEGQPSRRSCSLAGHGTPTATCSHKTPNHDTLDEYIWGSTSCDLFHPAELTSYTAVCVRFRNYLSGADGDVRILNTPTREVIEGNVVTRCDGIRCLDSNKRIQHVPEVARRYCMMARYLAQARTFGALTIGDDIIRGFDKVEKIVKMHKSNNRLDQMPLIDVTGLCQPMIETSTVRASTTTRIDPNKLAAATARVELPLAPRCTSSLIPSSDSVPEPEPQVGESGDRSGCA
uniref:Putative coat protein n=1 Tax=Leishmania RNA virus 1 TaxID=1678905 RepID=A0A220QLV5_9VIRU|nr:putative coat protein [Leishmania RNA virus 1]ASK05985.1 putative coat protein [Leishmania RNA virus 1]